MNLRDHVEIAVLLARLALPAAARSLPWSDDSRSRFWNHVRYLEHLWDKDLARVNRPACESARLLLLEEILVTDLLVRVIAAASASREAWQTHAKAVDTLFDRNCPDLENPGQLRLGRVRRRLSHWGDFLVSRHPEGEQFGDDPARCQEFRCSYCLHDEAVWSLFLRGISRAVPGRTIEDPNRSAVHRLLQDSALELISPELFLGDGRLKPRWMRRIESTLVEHVSHITFQS